MGQLREVEAKRDQMLAEESNKEDPQAERERLLASVKDNNRETANMDREYVDYLKAYQSYFTKIS